MTVTDSDLDQNASAVELTTVKVTSLSDATGFTLTLGETGVNTGVFERQIQMNPTATSVIGDALTNPTAPASDVKIRAADGDIVKAEYVDVSEANVKRTATVNVELTPPTFSNLSPANKSFTNVTQVTLAVDVTDSLSGVKATTITFWLCLPSQACQQVADADSSVADGFTNNAYTLIDITGGKRASVTITDLGAWDGGYEWRVKADDNAGNQGVSNLPRFTLDTTALALGIDSDSGAASAVTGQWWDPTKVGMARLITDPAKAKNTSIRVVFDGDLDGDSVQSADFEVNDVAPLAAKWFSGKANSVFLTVPAMAASATPKVEVLAGAVSDVAGNANFFVLTVTVSKDGIAPTLTVTLTGDTGAAGVPLGESSVTATITSNETLLGVPTVEYVAVKKDAQGNLVKDGFLKQAGGWDLPGHRYLGEAAYG